MRASSNVGSRARVTALAAVEDEQRAGAPAEAAQAAVARRPAGSWQRGRRRRCFWAANPTRRRCTYWAVDYSQLLADGNSVPIARKMSAFLT
jgi:hypothetical protein